MDRKRHAVDPEHQMTAPSTSKCTVALSAGQADYDRTEDAPSTTYSVDGTTSTCIPRRPMTMSVMVNRTSSDGDTRHGDWIKACNGMEVTLTAPSVPDDTCLLLEDIIDGWSGSIEPGMAYTYSVTTAVDEHRFNLIAGRDLHGGIHGCRLRQCPGWHHCGHGSGFLQHVRAGGPVRPAGRDVYRRG